MPPVANKFVIPAWPHYFENKGAPIRVFGASYRLFKAVSADTDQNVVVFLTLQSSTVGSYKWNNKNAIKIVIK